MVSCAGFLGDVCDYGASECTCAGAGMAGPTWRCHTCPATQPAAGSSCTGDTGATCAYGTTDCSCTGATNSVWTCGTCPAALPTNGSACSTADIYCDYAGTGCVCTPTAAGDAWHCNAPCPTAKPAPGDACSTPANEMCTYGTSTCVCVQGQFFCN
jgi:hypothetical protein